MRKIGAGLLVLVVLGLGVFWAATTFGQQTDKNLLEDLRKLGEPIDASKIKDKTSDELKRRSDAAAGLLKVFEEKHAKSPLLNEARVEALKILSADPQAADQAQAVAKQLVASAPQGSDLAAQADLYLAMQSYRALFKDAKNVEDFKATWAKNEDAIRKRVAAFLAAYPKYKPGADAAQGLVDLTDLVGDTKTKHLILEAVAKNFPDHPLARLWARQQSVGKEFAFEFTAVGSDKKMSMKDLRGKVVVIDFWATWCGPCKAEIPHMKKLYEQYAAKGLEIIGVSLDDKEAALTAYVKEHKVAWPQVVGKAAQALAAEWGVEAIPVVFVIDRQGRLHSLEARGKLEELVPKLLEAK